MKITLESVLHSADFSRRQKVAAIVCGEGGATTIKRIREVALALGLHELQAWNLQDIIGKSQGGLKNLSGKIILTTAGKTRLQKEGITLDHMHSESHILPERPSIRADGSYDIMISHAPTSYAWDLVFEPRKFL
jgi:hypothetical protein